MSGKKIAVIGAGVVGLSTAIVLRLMNFRVQIFSSESLQTETKNPFFASQYPAASILPHSIEGVQVEELFLPSKKIFHRLLRVSTPGIVHQKHFEVYTEGQPTLPAYTHWMDGFKLLDVKDESFMPRHPEFPSLTAWSMDMLFANWALYGPTLQQLCKELEIPTVLEEVAFNSLRTRFPKNDYAAIVLATGTGWDRQNKQNLSLLRGDLVIAQSQQRPRTPDGELFSYNFNPPLHYYSTNNGCQQDVYCYSRPGECVLGGSRITGTWSQDNWMGDQPKAYSNDDSLPDPFWKIFTINQEILAHSCSMILDLEAIKETKTGYRYLGPQSKVRLEMDATHTQPLIHSYGFGGSGVSLSWGVALKSARMLQDSLDPSRLSIDAIAEDIGSKIEHLMPHISDA